VANTKLLRSARNDKSPVKAERSLSASDATKQVISMEMQLNLPKLTSNESLSVQTQTVKFSVQISVKFRVCKSVHHHAFK
jgi:hypothetical protein